MCIRDRGKYGTKSYEFKLSLAPYDRTHLEKFKSFIQYTGKIFQYKTTSSFSKENYCLDTEEARISLYSKEFGAILESQYGIIPRRNDPRKLLSHIPMEYRKHFIRGIVDGDGSMSDCMTRDGNHLTRKIHISICGVEKILDYIQNVLIEEELIKNRSKIYRRHEGGDGDCRNITYCGNIQCRKILSWMYEDSTIYLDRKYNKYKSIMK